MKGRASTRSWNRSSLLANDISKKRSLNFPLVCWTLWKRRRTPKYIRTWKTERDSLCVMPCKWLERMRRARKCCYDLQLPSKWLQCFVRCVTNYSRSYDLGNCSHRSCQLDCASDTCGSPLANSFFSQHTEQFSSWGLRESPYCRTDCASLLNTECWSANATKAVPSCPSLCPSPLSSSCHRHVSSSLCNEDEKENVVVAGLAPLVETLQDYGYVQNKESLPRWHRAAAAASFLPRQYFLPSQCSSSTEFLLAN